jgi:hypothetical protein
VESFITRRIAEFEQAKIELPFCSEEERWKSADVFALFKGKNKRATKLFKTNEEALSHIEVFALQGHEIRFRPGVNKRCASYCDVSAHCEWWAQNQPKEHENGTE